MARFAHAIPADHGGTVLDIGCNGGFYSIEMKRRGAARVVAIDFDEGYLPQARFAAQILGHHRVQIACRSTTSPHWESVSTSAVPWGALSPVLSTAGAGFAPGHATRDLFVCQSMQRGDPSVEQLAEDYPFEEKAIFERPGFPRLAFVEHCYAGDNTNWWIPNHACTAAMLRSAGFVIAGNPEEEVFVCRPGPANSG